MRIPFAAVLSTVSDLGEVGLKQMEGRVFNEDALRILGGEVTGPKAAQKSVS